MSPAFQRRPVRWLLAFLSWTVIVLFYSTRTGRLGQPLAWSESLKLAASQWYVWGLLAPLIIRFDRLLPVAREALIRRFLCHLPLSFLFTAAYIYSVSFVRSILLPGSETFSLSITILKASWGGAFHWSLLVYWVIVGFYVAYGYDTDLKERRLRTAELERLLAEARLSALRAQLHPHFLFNALNAISAHIERNPRTARRMLEQLGELLRLSLEHSDDPEIPLERELAFLDRYLAIQKARFEDRLEVTIRVDPDTLHALVPTFVLEPLVENAIRYGVAPRSSPGTIEVSAWREDRRLHLRVRDDGPGLPAGWRLPDNQGVGIANTRERLRRLYGDGQHRFEIVSEPGTGVRVDLSFPFRDAEQRAAGS